ncbi:MAG: pyridoxal phosphate-dependent aminotransferase family protein [Thermonemataceae bacterium]|nr:pyridoxal phosphate-dependent aminotransferase family protein [Thermonemataceae bacterium]
MKLLEKLSLQLQKRVVTGNLRQLSPQSNLIDFSSNDYLGLAANSILEEIIYKEIQKLPKPHLGATGSRLISGTQPYSLLLERFLADFFQAEAALIFNSGFQLNLALLATIAQKGDTILLDDFIHASLREGARLSLAQKFYFQHNSLADLERKMQKAQGNIFVVIETVYSMEGDIAPIAEISKLCEKYEAYLIVDEAHSTGIFGENGEGYLLENNLHQAILARVYTFGKALGGHGACVVGSQVLIDYLINFARPFIYTTALPLHSLVHIKEAFEFIKQHKELKQQLYININFFREILGDFRHEHITLKESFSPIQVLKIGGNERTKFFAQELQKAGFDLRAVLSPTVKEGEEILRICLHSFNTSQEIEFLAKNIEKVALMV